MTEEGSIKIIPVAGLPLFRSGMALAREIADGVARSGGTFQDGDVCVVAQKIVSKVEGRMVDLATVTPGAQAAGIAQRTGRDPRMIQLIVDQSQEIMRATAVAVIARHRTGHVLANAGIDASNVLAGAADTVLLWPEDPDASARAIRTELAAITGKRLGVVIADSMGRAWRIGTVGAAIGCAGLTVLDDRRGIGRDLFGRTLEATVIAVADAIAAAATLAMGEADEATPAAIVRGVGRWVCEEDGPGAASGLRPVEQDMFR